MIDSADLDELNPAAGASLAIALLACCLIVCCSVLRMLCSCTEALRDKLHEVIFEADTLGGKGAQGRHGRRVCEHRRGDGGRQRGGVSSDVAQIGDDDDDNDAVARLDGAWTRGYWPGSFLSLPW